MGETYIKMKVHGPNSSEELGNVLVDTGATFTKIPLDYAQRIGIIPEYEVDVQLGDGSRAKRQVGYARVEIEGFEDLSRTVPIAFSEGNQVHLLGLTTLEILALKVDPSRRVLERTNPIEY